MGDSADGMERLDDEAAAEIRAALGRVLASDIFRAAPQLSAFLTFVVERTVEGRRSELKGYTIAVEALGRAPEFDPQSDPIVRVEAGRLRRALTQYYAWEGREDPLRIAVPVGAYVPLFLNARPPAGEPDEGPPPPVLEKARTIPFWGVSRWPFTGVAALAFALMALVLWYVYPGMAGPAGSQDRAAPDLPTIAIMMPQLPSDPALADRLHRSTSALIDVMTRFDDLVVVKAPPPGAPVPDDADYVLEATLRAADGTLEGFGRLRAVKDGRIIWASSSRRPTHDVLTDQDISERMRRIATRLAEPFGIIHAEGRQNPASTAGGCIYDAFDYQRFLTRERHQAALECLERIVARDPGFYPAWAHLSGLLMSEYMSGRVVDAKPLLDRALSTALTAQRLAPSSARAQQVVMDALFLRGATDDAVNAGREAMNRNPYDPMVMADLGAIYVRLNRAEEALPLLKRAVELTPGRPSWYDFYAYLAAYLAGSPGQAQTYFGFLAADASPLGLLARALQAGRDGDLPHRQELLRQLAEQVPIFGSDPHAYMARKGFGMDVAKRLMGDLGFE